jgi:hypothetical protein
MRDNLDHLNVLRGEVLLRSSESDKTKIARLGRPQSQSLKGIEAGIGLLPDGSLNIFVPGTPPSRWFKARSQSGEVVYVRVDYNVDGHPKSPDQLAKFEIAEETDDSLAENPSKWIRNGLCWKRKM